MLQFLKPAKKTKQKQKNNYNNNNMVNSAYKPEEPLQLPWFVSVSLQS